MSGQVTEEVETTVPPQQRTETQLTNETKNATLGGSDTKIINFCYKHPNLTT